MITINPLYSPWAPELGCNEVAAKPVISERYSCNLFITSWYPFAWSTGTKGCMLFHSVQLNGIISEAEFSFIVQDPSEIIDWVKDKSLFSKDFIYLINEVSEWYELKTGWDKISDSLSLINSISVGNSSILDSLFVNSSKTEIISSRSFILVFSFTEIDISLSER